MIINKFFNNISNIDKNKKVQVIINNDYSDKVIFKVYDNHTLIYEWNNFLRYFNHNQIDENEMILELTDLINDISVYGLNPFELVQRKNSVDYTDRVLDGIEYLIDIFKNEKNKQIKLDIYNFIKKNLKNES